MNSIAFMSKGPPKEAMALAAAMKHHGASNAAVAKHMGVSDGLVSQWKVGHRPVAAEHAPRLAKFLGINDPAQISAAYGRVQQGEVGNVVPLRDYPSTSGDERRTDLVIARLENDIDSLRFALAAMVSAMTVHRPAEAADVARSIRKHVPAKFVQQGYLRELLQALDKGAQPR